MASRLELVLRAGRAAETGPRAVWNGLAGRLTDDVPPPPPGEDDPTLSPRMQEALDVAGEIEERNREQRERDWQLQRRVEAENRARRQRESAYKDNLTRARENLAETERREQRVLDAYVAGQSNMRAIIRENQERTLTTMYRRLDGMGTSTEDVLHFLLEQEAYDTPGANPGRHLRIVALEDNLAHIQKLTQELTMLKSALDVPGEDYQTRLERMFA